MCKPAAVESTSPGLDASKPASNAALARLAPLLAILLALFLFVYPRLLAATAALCAFAVVDSFWSAAKCEVVATGDAARLLKCALAAGDRLSLLLPLTRVRCGASPPPGRRPLFPVCTARFLARASATSAPRWASSSASRPRGTPTAGSACR